MSQFKPTNTANTVTAKQPMPRPQAGSVGTAQESTFRTSLGDDIFANADRPLSDEIPGSTGNSIALYLTMAFVFLRFSFLHELLMSKIGFDSHLLLLIGGSAVIAAMLSGGLFNGITDKISLAWMGFTACMVLASATSIWRGGSFAVLYPYLRTTMILVILIPAVAISPKSLVQVLKTIGLAGLAIVVLGLTVNDFRSGRLELSGAGASIENSNDYAALLILVMPAIAYLSMRRGASFILKIVGLLALGLSCFLILSTGSRGALISMALSALYVLKAGSGRIRLAILLGIPTVALLAIPFLPAEASQRLASLFSSQPQTGEAAASGEERTALLVASLHVTAQHPLLGVGPGTFQEYQAQEAKDRGQRGMWHETHNSYTQVSSECGVPALLFYLGAIFLTFRVFKRGRKALDPNIRAVSAILGLMLVSFCICMFFLSQAYGFGFPVLGGLAIATNRLISLKEEPRPSII